MRLKLDTTHADKSYINNISMQQNKAIRLICKVFYRDSTLNYSKAMNSLKLSDLFKFKSAPIHIKFTVVIMMPKEKVKLQGSPIYIHIILDKIVTF